jgi:hypothetical protein
MTEAEVRAISKEIFGEPWDLQKFITETNKPEVIQAYGYHPVYEESMRPHIILGNLMEISVQASYFHWCDPRKTHMDKYDTYEVLLYGKWDWHKMEKEARLKCHKEAIKYMWDNYDEHGEPYGYVPHDILQNFISACGGILALKKASPSRLIIEKEDIDAAIINILKS